MNKSIFIRAALMPVIVVAPFVAASASAWSQRGQLSDRSEATIGISVSVAPRFTVASEARQNGANPLIAINAPRLRFRIIRQPTRETGSIKTLYLVVPD